jgi:serine protease
VAQSRAVRTALVLLALLAALPASAKRAPCDGRYLIAGSLIPGVVSIDVVTVDGKRVSTNSGCPPKRAKVRSTRRATRIAVAWRSCAGLGGKARLAAKIDAASCSMMTGRFRAKRDGIDVAFGASRSVCGDHVIDPALGEQCDGGGCAAGSACDASCACVAGATGVTGQLAVPPTAVADVDTADPAMAGDNDSLATAEDGPVVGTVGGAAYRAGPTDFDDDYFRVELDGQPITVTLAIASPENTDLDLYLRDGAGNDIVPPSAGTSTLEQLDTGTYAGTAYVVVHAYDGGVYAPMPWTNYVLSFGQTPSGAVTRIAPDAEFVPGEVVVRLRESVPALATERLALADTELARVTGDARGGSGALFRLPPPTALGAARDHDARRDTLAAVQGLRRRGDVLWAEPNYIRRASAVPNDPFYGFQWHYPLISLPQAWDVTQGSSQVIVAVVDTGQLLGHPDFAAGRFVPGYDFISDATRARDGNGIDPDPSDAGDLAAGGRSSFHGTHVAGTIGANTNNGAGVAGVDWNARIMPIRVLGQGGGTTYDIAQGIRFAAGLANDSGTVPAQRADVINMSLGGPGSDNTGRAAVQAARAAGVTVVVAAGNDNQDAAGYSPASFPEVVTVSATDLQRSKAPYSNFGSVVDVAAPGGDTSVDRNGDGYADGVLSTLADDSGGGLAYSFVFYQGTSMASPHVAGVAALMQAAYRAANGGARYTPSQLDVWLASGAITDALGATNWAGHGLINARRAVETAGGTATPQPPSLTAVPASVNLGTDLAQIVVQLLNAGSGTVTVTGASADQPWVTVQPSLPLPAPAPVDLTILVDRTGLAAGQVYTAQITVTSDAGPATVPVAMQVPLGPGQTGGDVGVVYVLLVDPDTHDTLAEAVSVAADGYPIAFTAPIPPGTYLLVAGTDRNNDGFIGDAGEAFGVYPTAATPAPITVAPDTTVTVTLPVVEEAGIGAGAAAAPGTPARRFRRLR